MQTPPPSHGRALRAAFVGAGLLALLAVVAFASRSGFGHNKNATPSTGYVSYAMTVFLIVMVLMIPVAIYQQFLRVKEQVGGPRRSFVSRVVANLMTAAFFSFLAWVMYYIYRHRHLNRFFHFGSGGAAGKAGKGLGGKLHHAATAQPQFEWSVFWVAVAIVALLTVGLVVYYKSRPPLPVRVLDDDRTVADELAAEMGGAIEDLEAEPDARRAVIAAYARMEGVLARNGLLRRPSETPLEYLRHVLLGLTTRGEAVSRLTGLFEEAKFSRHEIGGTQKQQAIAALREIREDLQGAPA